MKHWLIFIALSWAPMIALAQTVPVRTAESSGGMVITGDREAPLVLHIVPWQEPKPVVPPQVGLQPLLPEVVDRSRSVLEEPMNRPPGLEAVKAR